MVTDQKRKALELFAQGRRQYKLMQFAEARDSFRLALESDPSDSPSRVYVERC